MGPDDRVQQLHAHDPAGIPETRRDGLKSCSPASSKLFATELLIDEASGGDQLAFGERSLQRADLRHIGWPVAAQRQRPDARIDEEAQSRERSRL